MKRITFICLICFLSFITNAQEPVSRVYSLDEIFQHTLKNNQTLKISSTNLDIAKQQVAVVKNQRLPGLTTAVSAGYLGNGAVIRKDFSHAISVPMPHFTNKFAVEASQVIYKGHAISANIEAAGLQAQIAGLDLKEDILGIKLLVAAHYFDIYKLYNQRDVYIKNTKLIELRLQQIKSLYQQGMVTRNDVIRSELQISNLNQTILEINNDIHIINKELTTVAGLPETVLILPDTNKMQGNIDLLQLSDYKEEAQRGYPAIRAAEANVNLAEKGLSIAKSGRMPTLSAYAGNTLQRPITSSSPAVDQYSNGWQAGLSLSYNLASLYQSPRTIKLSRMQVDQAKDRAILARQNISVNVNTAYIKYVEAVNLAQTLQQNVRLAAENYRIIEKKYLNQLALFIDMLDATNTKLDAELQHANAEINIRYAHYQLKKEIGNL